MQFNKEFVTVIVIISRVTQ